MTNRTGARRCESSGGLAISLGAAALCFLALLYGLMGPTLPLLGVAYQVNLAQQGALMTIYALGYLLAVVGGGFLADRWGKEPVLTTGLAVMASGLLATGLSQSYLLGITGMVLIGAGGGLVEMVVSAIVSDRVPERRAVALNLLQLVFGLSALSPLVITWLGNTGNGWRYAFLGLGAGALLLAPLSAQLRPRPVSSDDRIDIRALRLLVRRPRLWAIAVSQAAYVFAEVSIVSWMVDYLTQARGSSSGQANSAVSLFFVAMLAGRLVCTALSTRVRLDRLQAGMAGAVVVGTVAVLLAPMGSWAWIPTGMLGLFYAGIFGTTLAYAGNTYPEYSGTVFGLILATGALGAVVGPWLVGVVSSAT
ncbi:MAG: MFS transporter, partial [Anaerolineales bacterium]|nr:MFS transporter [Anaerolineales bacterium]